MFIGVTEFLMALDLSTVPSSLVQVDRTMWAKRIHRGRQSDSGNRECFWSLVPTECFFEDQIRHTKVGPSLYIYCFSVTSSYLLGWGFICDAYPHIKPRWSMVDRKLVSDLVGCYKDEIRQGSTQDESRLFVSHKKNLRILSTWSPFICGVTTN